jgi:CubicO group peptidase (beta-lactamase class C family)
MEISRFNCTLCLMVALSAVSGISAADTADPTPFRAVTPLNFDAGGAVSRQFHLHAESYLETATIARTGPPHNLEVRTSAELAGFSVSHRDGRSSFEKYIANDALLDSVIVMHNGNIVFESYPAMKPWQRHFAWSVSKIFAAVAIAALVDQGDIDLEQTVGKYIPQLRDTAWNDSSVRDVANMASGIDCLDEDGYQNNTTCIYRMEEALDITAPAGYGASFLEHLQSMQRRGESGLRYEYVSANTNVLMLLVEAASGEPYATAIRELIWDRLGPEADALIAISDEGHAYASGGMLLRLRDLARFGELFGRPNDFGVFDVDRVREMRDSGPLLHSELKAELANTFGADLPIRAGWQWDSIWADGGMFKSGYLGQGLYVDPDRQLVIAWFGTGLDFNEQTNDMASVSRQLATSGLFDPGH